MSSPDGAQLAQRRQAVHARHHQIEHDQVRTLAFEPPLERAGVVQHRHFDALTGQIVAQQVAEFDVVIDDKYLSSHGMKFNAQQMGFPGRTPLKGLPGVTAKGAQ